MRIIEEYKLDCYKGKLNLGFNSLTKGGDFRSLKFHQMKGSIVSVAASKIRLTTRNLLSQYRTEEQKLKKNYEGRE